MAKTKAIKKISIIVPAYNVEKYLTKTIDSILSQNYENIELILVDDGSSDRSGAICDSYEQKDSRIIVIHKENGGLSDARNVGLEIAHGDYVLFVDGDDYLSDNVISLIVEKMDSLNLDCLMFNANRITHESKPLFDLKSFDSVMAGADFLEQITEANILWVMVWLYCYRRSVLIENGIKFKKGIISEDEHFTPRAVVFCNRVTYINVPLYNYVLRSDSITTTVDTKRIIKRYEDVIDTLYELESFYNAHIAKGECKNLRQLSVNKYLHCAVFLKHYGKLKKVDYKFIKRNLYFFKMKIKVFVFRISYKLYAHFAGIKIS